MQGCLDSTLFPTRRFVATVPAGSRHHADIRIETEAFDLNDARHLVLCMLGKRAADEATIEEIGGATP